MQRLTNVYRVEVYESPYVNMGVCYANHFL